MKKNHVIIIILSFVIVLLLILCAVLYLKNEIDDDRYERAESSNQSSSVNNNYDNQSSDGVKSDHDVNDDNEDYISRDKALQIALDSLNINKSDIYDLDNDLEYKYGVEVYEIDFKYNRYEYDFYINAKTGEIVKSFKERD